MLGVRLTPEIESRFARFARAKGRPKSDIARTAIVEYLDRHGDDLEFERQYSQKPFARSKTFCRISDEINCLLIV